MHPLLEHNRRSVFGRVKNDIMSRITGAESVIPSDREVMRFLMDAWKDNVEFGRFLFHVMHTGPIQHMEFPARISVKQFDNILGRLNRSEVFYRISAEGRVHGVPGNPSRGCVVLGHERPSGEPGYYAAVFGDHFLDGCSFVSLVPPGKNNVQRVGIFTTNGWREVVAEEANNIPELRIVVAALREHLDWTDGRISRRNLIEDPATTPPDDPEYMRRIRQISRRKLTITQATVPLTSLEPFDVEFCRSLRRDTISLFSQRIRRGYRPELAVYSRGDNFVVSDDYYALLGYFQAGVSPVPVAILGGFRTDAVNVVSTGGIELLPPVQVLRTPVPFPGSPALQQWQVEHEIAAQKRTAKPSDLAATWLVFADYVAHRRTTEAEIHKCLSKFPIIVAAGGNAVESEVWLGKQYKMDLVIRYSGLEHETVLVELENPQHSIFTNCGRPRKAVTHATQQVEDWLSWIRQHPDDAFVETLAGMPAKGLVVIGRSRDLTDDQRRRLADLNVGKNVQIITYDELLDRFRDLILQQCDDTRD